MYHIDSQFYLLWIDSEWTSAAAAAALDRLRIINRLNGRWDSRAEILEKLAKIQKLIVFF